jgi:hypothetical protein
MKKVSPLTTEENFLSHVKKVSTLTMKKIPFSSWRKFPLSPWRKFPTDEKLSLSRHIGWKSFIPSYRSPPRRHTVPSPQRDLFFESEIEKSEESVQLTNALAAF